MTNLTLPAGFTDLEPFVADWALPTRAQRYDTRLSQPYDELIRFYDAIAPRAEEAIAYLNELDINALPDDATRLLHLLYSMILVSYAVNVFKQAESRIPARPSSTWSPSQRCDSSGGARG